MTSAHGHHGRHDHSHWPRAELLALAPRGWSPLLRRTRRLHQLRVEEALEWGDERWARASALHLELTTHDFVFREVDRTDPSPPRRDAPTPDARPDLDPHLVLDRALLDAALPAHPARDHRARFVERFTTTSDPHPDMLDLLATRAAAFDLSGLDPEWTGLYRQSLENLGHRGSLDLVVALERGA